MSLFSLLSADPLYGGAGLPYIGWQPAYKILQVKEGTRGPDIRLWSGFGPAGSSGGKPAALCRPLCGVGDAAHQ